MTPEHRIELLRLTKPSVSNPDLGLWLKSAKELEAYVMGAGQADVPPPKPTLTLPPEARTTRPVAGPAQRK